jgi:hypothetical protein
MIVVEPAFNAETTPVKASIVAIDGSATDQLTDCGALLG